MLHPYFTPDKEEVHAEELGRDRGKGGKWTVQHRVKIERIPSIYKGRVIGESFLSGVAHFSHPSKTCGKSIGKKDLNIEISTHTNHQTVQYITQY